MLGPNARHALPHRSLAPLELAWAAPSSNASCALIPLAEMDTVTYPRQAQEFLIAQITSVARRRLRTGRELAVRANLLRGRLGE